MKPKIRHLVFSTALSLLVSSPLLGLISSDDGGVGNEANPPQRKISIMGRSPYPSTISYSFTAPEGFIDRSIIYGQGSYSKYDYIGPSVFTLSSTEGTFEVVLPDSTINEFFVILDGINNRVEVIKGEDVYSNLGSLLYYNFSSRPISLEVSVNQTGVVTTIPPQETRFVQPPGPGKIWQFVYAPCDSQYFDEGEVLQGGSITSVVGIPTNSFRMGSIYDLDTDCVVRAWTPSVRPDFLIDLDIDSDNNNGSGMPDRSYDEEFLEAVKKVF